MSHHALDHGQDDDHDRGLAFDLSTLTRRGLLGLAAGAGATAVLAACSSNGAETTSAGTSATTGASTTGGAPTTAGETTTSAAGTTSASTAASTASTTGDTTAASCEPIPEETAGPYPGDGSNGPNVLAESGVVRQDIRSSIGTATGVAEGVPMTVELLVTDTAAGCVPLAGAAVYLWHCDRGGGYSMYSEGVENENYLRGVQETDADGRLTFTSIFPACYSGRWPHAHFEIYASVADATSGGSPVAISQLALPQDVCDVVYATTGYEQSVSNLAQISLESDNVFGEDGAALQLATVTGDTTAGYTATLNVAV